MGRRTHPSDDDEDDNNNNNHHHQQQPSAEQQQICPYRVLGVRRDATKAEIRLAYRRLALLNHPSRRSSSSGGGGATTSSSSKAAPSKNKNNDNNNNNNNPSSSTTKTSSYDEDKTKYGKFVVTAAAFETLNDDGARRRYDKLHAAKHRTKEVWEHHHHAAMDTPKEAACHGLGCGLGSRSWDDTDRYSDNGRRQKEQQQQRRLNERRRKEEEQLLGGPLHRMYKSRNHAPFTDPFQLFNTVFQSDIFHTNQTKQTTTTTTTTDAHDNNDNEDSNGIGSSPLLKRRRKQLNIPPNVNTNNGNWMKKRLLRLSPTVQKTSSSKKSPPTPIVTDTVTAAAAAAAAAVTGDIHTFHSHSNAWTGTATVTDNGMTISKTTRLLDNGRRITKTEITMTDPVTGRKSTRIEVQRDDVEDMGEVEGIGGDALANEGNNNQERESQSVLDCCMVPPSMDNDDGMNNGTNSINDGVVWDCTKTGPNGVDQCLLVAAMEELLMNNSNRKSPLSKNKNKDNNMPENDHRHDEWHRYLFPCGTLIP